MVGWMAQMDETDLVYKGPWVRSAQQRLFQTLETDYAFPRATCRSLVNLMLDFVNETFGEKLHEGQKCLSCRFGLRASRQENLGYKIGPGPSDFSRQKRYEDPN
jgi:hypothetical protein